ncbi:MAG: phage tail length tape measure family protein [Deferribacterales bacterium]
MIDLATLGIKIDLTSLNDFVKASESAIKSANSLEAAVGKIALKSMSSGSNGGLSETAKAAKEAENAVREYQKTMEKSQALASKTNLGTSFNEQKEAIRQAADEAKSYSRIVEDSQNRAIKTNLRVSFNEQKEAIRETAQEAKKYGLSLQSLNRQRSSALISEFKQQAVVTRQAQNVIDRYAGSVRTLDGIQEHYRLELERVRQAYALAGGSAERLQLAERNLGDIRDQQIARWKAYNSQITGTGEAAQFSRHHLINLGYQLQDIIVGFTSGQRPMTIFIQQGAQVAGIASNAGVGIKGLAAAMGTLALSAARASVVMMANPYFLAITTVVGGATLAVSAFKKELNDSGGFDSYVNSLGLSIEQINSFETEIEKAGGVGVSFRDIMGTLFDELDFTEAKKEFAEFGVFVLQEGINTYVSYKAIGKAVQTYSNRTYFNLIANMFGKKDQIKDAGNEATMAMFAEEQKIYENIDKFKKEVQERTKARYDLILTPIVESNSERLTNKSLSQAEQYYKQYQDTLTAIRAEAKVHNLGISFLRAKEVAAYDKYTEQMSKLHDKERRDAERANAPYERRADTIRTYIAALNMEISRTGILTEERERLQKIDQLDTQLTRKDEKFKLTEKERESINALLLQQQQAAKIQKEVDDLYNNSSSKAIENYYTKTQSANIALEKGFITQETWAAILGREGEALKSATDKVYAYKKALDETVRIYDMFGDDLAVAKALTPEVKAGMTDEQIKKAEQYIRTTESMGRVNAELGKIWEETTGKGAAFEARIEAIKKKMADTSITLEYYNSLEQAINSEKNQNKFTLAGAGSVYSETQGKIDSIVQSQIDWNNASKAGLVTADQYLSKARELYAQELQLAALRGENLDGSAMTYWGAFSSGLDLYAANYEGTFSRLQAIGQNFFNSLSSGAGDAFSSMIIDGNSFGDAIQELNRTVLRTLISSLVQAAIQAAIFRAVLTGSSMVAIPSISNTSTATTWGSGGVGFAAAGGYISGAGTGTSDSIPMRLSNGEFVTNARATSEYRPLLEAINSGRKITPADIPTPSNQSSMVGNTSAGSLSTASPTIIVQSPITVSGNGDRQLAAMLEQTARTAAQQGAQMGYQMVYKDAKDNGSIAKKIKGKA